MASQARRPTAEIGKKGVGRHSFALTIEAQRCTNGETYEFWLALDGTRVGKSVFKTRRDQQPLRPLALEAAKQILSR